MSVIESSIMTDRAAKKVSKKFFEVIGNDDWFGKKIAFHGVSGNLVTSNTTIMGAAVEEAVLQAKLDLYDIIEYNSISDYIKPGGIILRETEYKRYAEFLFNLIEKKKAQLKSINSIMDEPLLRTPQTFIEKALHFVLKKFFYKTLIESIEILRKNLKTEHETLKSEINTLCATASFMSSMRWQINFSNDDKEEK